MLNLRIFFILSEEGKDWIVWSSKKADWYDPTIARNHGRDEEFREF